jgi:hypothetical protein
MWSVLRSAEQEAGLQPGPTHTLPLGHGMPDEFACFSTIGRCGMSGLRSSEDSPTSDAQTAVVSDFGSPVCVVDGASKETVAISKRWPPGSWLGDKGSLRGNHERVGSKWQSGRLCLSQ